jgi:uncharacterized membrane protein YphA (DoxX/SURF4 family)
MNWQTIVLWILRAALAALFLFAGYMKLKGDPMMVAEFGKVGLGDWFRYFTAALEVIGGVCVLIPGISVFGALVLLVVDIGAFFAQVFVLHDDWVHTIVVGLVIAAVIYLQTGRFGSTKA